MSKPQAIDRRQLATILAALRFWRREGLASGGHEHDIASDSDTLAPLSNEEIDALCEALNTDGPPVAAVIEIDGGAIYCVRSSVPMRVVILDANTEGGDTDRIHEVSGKKVSVSDYDLVSCDGASCVGVYPAYVAGVLEQMK